MKLKYGLCAILWLCFSTHLSAQDGQKYQENFWKVAVHYDLPWQAATPVGNIFLHLQPIPSVKPLDYSTSLIFSARPDFDQSHQDSKKFKANIEVFKSNLSKQFNFNYRERAGFFQNHHAHPSYQFAYDYQVGSSQLSAYTQMIACPNRLITATLMTKQGSLAFYLPQAKPILHSIQCI